MIRVKKSGFLVYPGKENEFFWQNSLQDESEEAALKLIFQGVNDFGTDFFVGLCGNVVTDEADGLAAITDEVSETAGYARIQLTRNATDWPTIENINGTFRVASKEITFTAAGGNFDKTFTRAFLTTVSTGTSGLLVAFTSPLALPKQLNDTETFPMRYLMYCD